MCSTTWRRIQMSDHYPIWIEMAIDSTETFLADKLDDRIEDEIRDGMREAIVNARVAARGLDRGDIDARLASIDSHTLRPRYQSDLVEDAVDLCRARAEEAGVAVEASLSDPRTLFLDGDQVKQVLLNLVINAIKFTDSGRIDIEALPPTTPGCSVRFEVNDTGIGIPKADQACIFEPFFSAGAGATSAQEKGTGLGLDIVRRNTEAMGGRAGVSSAPGSGSTFWIELPVLRE